MIRTTLRDLEPVRPSSAGMPPPLSLSALLSCSAQRAQTADNPTTASTVRFDVDLWESCFTRLLIERQVSASDTTSGVSHPSPHPPESSTNIAAPHLLSGLAVFLTTRARWDWKGEYIEDRDIVYYQGIVASCAAMPGL